MPVLIKNFLYLICHILCGMYNIQNIKKIFFKSMKYIYIYKYNSYLLYTSYINLIDTVIVFKWNVYKVKAFHTSHILNKLSF